MIKSRLQDKIKQLSKSPGVYIFKAKNGDILYVGKATSLKDRVMSYFSGREEERYISTAIDQIADVKIIKTDTVLEAFILEQNLIKRLQPKYNAMGKDDKSFAYIVLTKEEWPRFVILRKTELDKINLISNLPNSSNQIPNPKPQFLKNFQNSKFKIQNSKIYGPYTSRKNIEIVLKLLRRIFPYHNKPQKTEKGCLDSQIGLCPAPYDGKISRTDYLKNVRGIRMVLEGKKKSLIKKLEKEMKAYSKEHEYEKAAEVRNKVFALKHIRDVALISGDKNILSLSPTLSPRERGSMKNIIRIEAYDISNISGQFSVGSMVVFERNNSSFEPNKNEYRKFKIRSIQGTDDVGMMREVLIRRFNNSWPRPDLVLLDGGRGQLKVGEEVLKKFNLRIPIAAVTKGADRKIFNFQFSIFNQFSMNKLSNEIIKDRNLIQQIMDEAHRFAIAYHKKVRRKEFINYVAS